MKKGLLILLLVLSLGLTACGKAKEMSAAEKNAMNSFVEVMNTSAEGLFKLEFEEDTRILFVVVDDDLEIEDPEILRTTAVDLSKSLMEDVGEDYTVQLVYSKDKKKPLVSVKNGEIKKDNLDKILNEQSKVDKDDKIKETEVEELIEPTTTLDVEFNEPLTSEQEAKMNAYLEGGNSSDAAKSGLLKVEFDNSTRTYYVLYADDVTISDPEAVRKASLETTKELEMYVAGRVTVKVAYESQKDKPLLVLRNKKIIEDNLQAIQ